MCRELFRTVLFRIIIILMLTTFSKSALLYPASTIFQVISSVSVPISDLPPTRKVFFDWGLQMNYDMPFNVSSFYMVPIWATNQNRMSKRQVFTGAKHELDFTAKELYEGFESMFVRYGYDRSCLMYSICELAQHPFDESYGNLITDVLTFLFTPSINQGFAADEKYEQSLYSLAENRGYLGYDCQQLYPICKDGPFNNITIIHLK